MSNRVKAHRERMTAAGWKQSAIWLPPEAVEKLNELSKTRDITRQEVIIRLILEADSVQQPAPPKPKKKSAAKKKRTPRASSKLPDVQTPKAMELPLSVTTAPKGPYNDSFGPDGLLSYRYRGTDLQHPDNVGLRKTMQARAPLIYFHGVSKGKYVAAWPVYIVSDYPDQLAVSIAVDDSAAIVATASDETETHYRRKYVTATTRVRLHQRIFRERVLTAYQKQCTICQLKHTQLLEAAHIIPDSESSGEPVVTNGLSLCKIHHAAFDQNILGIRPDCVVEIREDILQEIDGPMLKHGLQEMHGSKIILPTKKIERPDANALEYRYERFLAV